MKIFLKKWNELKSEEIERLFVSNIQPIYQNTPLGNNLMKKYMFGLACEKDLKPFSLSLAAIYNQAPVALGQLYMVDFLSKYWGIKCGGINSIVRDRNNDEISHNAMEILITELLEQAKKQKFQFISANVKGEDILSVRALENCGFRYAEGFINMVGGTNPFREKFRVHGLFIRDATEDDYDQIADAYSKVSFPSRFASEQRFDTKKALQLYVNRFIEVHQKQLGKVFVAELDGQFAGALIAIIDDKMERKIGVKTNILSGMGIIVHPHATRKGIAMALIEHRQDYYFSKGVQFVNFGANFNNFPMINGLTKLGLKYGSLDMTFHKWL